MELRFKITGALAAVALMATAAFAEPEMLTPDRAVVDIGLTYTDNTAVAGDVTEELVLAKMERSMDGDLDNGKLLAVESGENAIGDLDTFVVLTGNGDGGNTWTMASSDTVVPDITGGDKFKTAIVTLAPQPMVDVDAGVVEVAVTYSPAFDMGVNWVETIAMISPNMSEMDMDGAMGIMTDWAVLI